MSIEVQGLKENLVILNKINPKLRREYGKKIRQIAKPAVDKINAKTPKSPGQMRGMRHSGRTGIYNAKPVAVKTNTRRARARNIAKGALYESVGTIVIGTKDAPTAIADMAGKVGNVQTSGMSRRYKGGKKAGQRHKLNGQGAGLIRGLKKYYGNPSRFMWPNGEEAIDDIAKEIIVLVQQVEREINQELSKIGSSANEVASMMRMRR